MSLKATLPHSAEAVAVLLRDIAADNPAHTELLRLALALDMLSERSDKYAEAYDRGYELGYEAGVADVAKHRGTRR